MDLITHNKNLKEHRKQYQNCSVGFVPTMGNLHQGHLSLVKKSLMDNDVTYVSIFVNPLQFAPHEDFNEYPRTLEDDLTKLKEIFGTISDKYKQLVVFAPNSRDDIFPQNFSSVLSVGPLSKILCGKSRPIFFDGVATVVYKLFSIFRPHRAYFGKKDYQQLQVIKKLVHDFELDIEIIGLPIVRDQDGLAMSSRNNYLTTDSRKQGLTLPKTLKLISEELSSISKDKRLNNYFKMKEKIILNDSNWEYLELREAKTLQMPTNDSKSYVLLGAYKVGKTRLIDNIEIKFS